MSSFIHVDRLIHLLQFLEEFSYTYIKLFGIIGGNYTIWFEKCIAGLGTPLVNYAVVKSFLYLSISTVFNDFPQSMKISYRHNLHSVTFSIRVLMARGWSLVLDSFLNPACIIGWLIYRSFLSQSVFLMCSFLSSSSFILTVPIVIFFRSFLILDGVSFIPSQQLYYQSTKEVLIIALILQYSQSSSTSSLLILCYFSLMRSLSIFGEYKKITGEYHTSLLDSFHV